MLVNNHRLLLDKNKWLVIAGQRGLRRGHAHITTIINNTVDVVWIFELEPSVHVHVG